MPILGVLASAITGNLSTNSYQSIQTVTVGSGGQSSVTFSSIPSTYKHLQIRGMVKSARTDDDGATYRIQFNSDSGANYTYHRLKGDGSSVVSDGLGGMNYSYFYSMAASSGSVNSSTFGVSVFDILDYSNTSKNKTIRVLCGYDGNGNGIISLGSSAWFSTSAVTSISLTIDGGTNFTQYSSFALYGIKGV
jgi:hypothetical protein